MTEIDLPGGSGKVPTGPMRFRGDWPGIFVRGDEALGMARILHVIVATPGLAPHFVIFLKEIAELLASCEVTA